jgi:hypothetical protein
VLEKISATASRGAGLLAGAVLGCVTGGCAFEPSKPPPELTWDGLALVEREGLDQVYLRPGANLSQYKRVILRDANVSFDQNWKPFAERKDGGGKVDPNAIRKEVEETFREITVRELQKGSYEIVTLPDDDVLRVVPSITDLSVTFPDPAVSSGGSAVVDLGHMTLVAELRDSTTNTALARVIDRMEQSSADRLELGSSTPNRAAAERIMTKWAVALREALDKAHTASPAKGQEARRAAE